MGCASYASAAPFVSVASDGWLVGLGPYNATSDKSIARRCLLTDSGRRQPSGGTGRGVLFAHSGSETHGPVREPSTTQRLSGADRRDPHPADDGTPPDPHNALADAYVKGTPERSREVACRQSNTNHSGASRSADSGEGALPRQRMSQLFVDGDQQTGRLHRRSNDP